MAYTRLQLCQRLAQEAQLSGAANGTIPTATTSQTGEMLQVVRDIDSAYEKLQAMFNNWDFLRFDFSFNTVAATASYTPTAAGLTEHKTWKPDTFRIYLTSSGVDGEQYLDFMPWPLFREAYLFGASRSNTGMPIKFTVKPDKSVMFYPIPDAIYTVVGEYFKRPQLLTADGTVPLIPDEHQLILVAMALMKHGRRESAQELYGLGKEEYEAMIGPLKRSQLPSPITAGAML